jgi:predicted transcriptional regulator
MRKEDAQAAVDAMGAEFDLDLLVRRLIIINQINVGRADAAAGRVHSVDEIESEIERWTSEALKTKAGSDAA